MGLSFWATLVASCWVGESSHHCTSEQCILLRESTLALLRACCVAGWRDSASLPCNLFPLGMDVLELRRVAENKGSVSLLPLLRVSLHPWPEHPCRRMQQERKMKEKNHGDRLSLSGKHCDVGNRRFSCSYLVFSLGPITDPLTLVISCDIAESQNSSGWKGPLEMVQIEVLCLNQSATRKCNASGTWFLWQAAVELNLLFCVVPLLQRGTADA